MGFFTAFSINLRFKKNKNKDKPLSKKGCLNFWFCVFEDLDEGWTLESLLSTSQKKKPPKQQQWMRTLHVYCKLRRAVRIHALHSRPHQARFGPVVRVFRFLSTSHVQIYSFECQVCVKYSVGFMGWDFSQSYRERKAGHVQHNQTGWHAETESSHNFSLRLRFCFVRSERKSTCRSDGTLIKRPYGRRKTCWRVRGCWRSRRRRCPRWSPVFNKIIDNARILFKQEELITGGKNHSRRDRESEPGIRVRRSTKKASFSGFSCS